MKILLAEDDVVLVDLLRFLFKREHFLVITAFDGEAALREFQNQKPDIVLLDLKMPRRTGSEVLKQIRQHDETPVIMLTATEDEDTKVNLFRLGADDYVVKPFQPRELLARVQAQLRHSTTARQRELKEKRILVVGSIQLDPMRHEVTVGDSPVRLTQHEYKMLEYLMSNSGRVVNTEEILTAVWGYARDVTRDVVRVTIARLRRKIESDPAGPHYIVAVPGEGYMFNDRP